MVGYYFWGFLGDRKYNDKYEEISTPDGNAFYSWSIIRELQLRGEEVTLLALDRDAFGYEKLRGNLFSTFAKNERQNAYEKLNVGALKNMKYAIIEWRWEIPGRNDEATKKNNFSNWQPDLELMERAIKLCNDNNIPFVIFDLDYKLTNADIEKYNIKYVIELGDKWCHSDIVVGKQVKIPFDFSHINEFELKNKFDNSLVYVGNRYERDWCIDKYIPEDLEDCMIYGNWKESGRDSEQRWNKLKFGKRLQTSEMPEVYSNSIATILLAKDEYCKMGFMTARIIEAVFYGCVPLFISEYGDDVISEYAGKCATFLTVHSKRNVIDTINILKKDVQLRNDIILYLRKHLRFMDAKFFIDDVEELIYG